MPNKSTQDAVGLLKETLDELEKPKGSVTSAIQKLLRAARGVGDEKVCVWCEVQLGNEKYTGLLTNLTRMLEQSAANKTSEGLPPEFLTTVNELGKLGYVIPDEELLMRVYKASGSYNGIGLLEERYAQLVKNKLGNDGTYYQENLLQNISYTRRIANEKAAALYNRLAYSDTPQTTMDLMRSEVDDKLLDLEPELAEKLMLAFKSVSGDNPEEWSHAMTSCRRFIEQLADVLYPATDEEFNGRKLGEKQYINRLWVYMDNAIESESNRDIAKAHVDFLGSYLQKVQKQSNKGVHTGVQKFEAVKAVLHTYLIVADLLGYLDKAKSVKPLAKNIHVASLDEIESALGVSRAIAKEIVKLRVQHGSLTPELLAIVKGVGTKTVAKAQEIFSFTPAS